MLSHSGQTRGSSPAADPFAFAPVMERHPDLHLLLAHLGGASWRQVIPFAAAYPTVSFDLCEIIAWTGAPGAPSADELGRLIRDIGSDRVLFGTDFPWYELDRTVDQLMASPTSPTKSAGGILGENAVRRMGLTVAGIARREPDAGAASGSSPGADKAGAAGAPLDRSGPGRCWPAPARAAPSSGWRRWAKCLGVQRTLGHGPRPTAR